MNSTALTTPVVFDGARISLVEHNGQRWITTSDLAAALEYEDTSTVTRIHARHSHEFTDEMTLTVNLTVKGFGSGADMKPVRIFSPRGCHLIAMFARKPKAEAFRRWVLDVLETPPKPPEPPRALPTSSDVHARIARRAMQLAQADCQDYVERMTRQAHLPPVCFNPDTWTPEPRASEALQDLDAALAVVNVFGARLQRVRDHFAAITKA